MPTQHETQRELAAAYQAAHDRIASLTRPLDPEQLVRRPSPNAWSVGEVLEHLKMMDNIFLTAVEPIVHRAPFDASAAARPWKSTIIGRGIARPLTRPAPLKSPAKAKPSTPPTPRVVEDFLAGDLRFRDLLTESTTRDWNRIRLRPPVAPWIPLTLNLGDVFTIHRVHVARHLGQIERVLVAVL